MLINIYGWNHLAVFFSGRAKQGCCSLARVKHIHPNLIIDMDKYCLSDIDGGGGDVDISFPTKTKAHLPISI